MRLFGSVGLSARSAAMTAAILAPMMGAVAAPAIAAEIIVTIDRVAAIDKIDVGGGQADFFAQVTIAGEVFKTERIRRADVITPNWVIRKRVRSGGTYPVKIEILDKDVLSKDDAIDINRVDNKRDLDFRVRTSNCRVLDFSPTYACGTRIVRTGLEKKAAEITFHVRVRR